MRVVADTNIYISALNFGGTAEEVLALARARTITVVVSPAILAEIEGVLVRKFAWSDQRARQAVRGIKEFADLVRPEMLVQVVTADEPDNRILECALEAQADAIITGDRHLRQLGTFHAIPIHTPGEFLELYRLQ